MSFSSDVKAELARQYSKSRHCQVAELSAMIMQEGRISMAPWSMSFESENPMLMIALFLMILFDYKNKRLLDNMHMICLYCQGVA